jgi:hypothetical protein
MHVSLIQTFLVAGIIVVLFQSHAILLAVMHSVVMPMVTGHMFPIYMGIPMLIGLSLGLCLAMPVHMQLVHPMLCVP